MLGYTPDVLWDMTLREFACAAEGITEMRSATRDLTITNAWLSAAWQREKRIPSLRSVLAGTEHSAEPDWDELERARKARIKKNGLKRNGLKRNGNGI